ERERSTGTGQASASAITPSTTAAATITPWGITSAPVMVASTSASSIIGEGSVRAPEQLTQDRGVLHGHPAHEALQHGGAIAGVAQHRVHELGDMVGARGDRRVVVRPGGSVGADE